MTSSALVSVIIPCYNQAGYLAEAIESVFAQSYRRLEIIVVDDGSTDDTSRVATKYPDVTLISQRNSGLSAARNAGIHASRGEYLVFLDADDRLLPVALETGTDRLNAHPDSVFAYGRYSLITEDGKRIPWSPSASAQGEPYLRPPYLRLLSRNYIGMHAAVMYRRTIFDEVGCFDTSLAACEDYEMFLRITRNHAIYCHGETIAEYRQHEANMSLKFDLMLKHAVSVLRSQRKYVHGNSLALEAYRAGLQNWRDSYGKKLFSAMRWRVNAREWRQAISGGLTLLRYDPARVAYSAHNALRKLKAQAPRLFSIRLSR
jgi:glycosyltransferase involved in cell wall biosynthesis